MVFLDGTKTHLLRIAPKRSLSMTLWGVVPRHTFCSSSAPEY